jgi:hypothetical protein
MLRHKLSLTLTGKGVGTLRRHLDFSNGDRRCDPSWNHCFTID